MVRVFAVSWVALAIGLSVTAQPAAKSSDFPPVNPAAARLEQTITGLDGPGFAIAYNPQTDTLAAACERGTIQTWNKDVLLSIRAGSGTGNVLRGHHGAVIALAWDGGLILVSAGSDRKLLFWNMEAGKVVQERSAAGPLKALAMSSDGKTLASAGEDMAVQLWEVASAKPLAKLEGQKDWISCLAFSLDGRQLASGAFDGSVCIWDVAGATKIVSLPAPSSPPPKIKPDPVPCGALAFSPDGKTLYLGGADGVIQVINPADGKILRALPGHTSAITGLAVHPAGNLLASVAKDRTIRLWNPANPQPLKVLEGHTAWVQGLVLIRLGTALASVGADQTVRIWDLTDPAKK
jgi:WD40 repeat protein